jgi:endonuclease/exonuclease/phosphatase family metal-dependent hydrolase
VASGAKERALRDNRRSPVFIIGITVLIAVALGTLLAAFARHAWLAELASHFSVHYFATAILVGAVSLLRRHYRVAVAAAALAFANAWHAAPYLIPSLVATSVAEGGDTGITAVSLNLFYRNADYAAVRDYLHTADPDVLVLSELTPVWAAELDSIIRVYPHGLAASRDTPWGLGVFSRYPLRDARFVDLGAPGSVNVQGVLDLPGRSVQLFAVHLSSPTSPERAALRNRQLGALTALLRERGRGQIPRLLVGDLNLTPFSPYFGDLLTATGMSDARRHHGVLGTWPTWLPMAPIHIDHCIADPALDVVQVNHGPPVGSDHYPLQIALRAAD